MSFRSSSGESGRASERVRRSLLLADDLPFSHVFTADRLAEVFEAEGVNFSDDDPDVIDTPAVTLWAFLSQTLLQELGVEVVTRLYQHREADFRRGRRLGADDHLVG